MQTRATVRLYQRFKLPKKAGVKAAIVYCINDQSTLFNTHALSGTYVQNERKKTIWLGGRHQNKVFHILTKTIHLANEQVIVNLKILQIKEKMSS